MTVLTYALHLREPILVTMPGGDPNTDESETLIPGSAMRGALVGRYLSQPGKSGETDEFKRLFLNGRVRFLNAYFSFAEGPSSARALPTPRCWVGGKDEQPPQPIYDRSQGRVPQVQGKFKEFMQWDGKKARAAEPLFEVAVHTARNRKMGRAVERVPDNGAAVDPYSALYRYRALAAGQTFRGAIMIDTGENDVALIHTLLRQGSLLLGGSHSAGYGLTDVEIDQPLPPDMQWREVTGEPGRWADIPVGERVTLYLISDAILRDSSGQPSIDILNNLPSDLHNSLVPMGKSEKEGPEAIAFARLKWVGGFNTKWGLPLPQTWAVEKGSVWVYQANKRISVQAIAQLEHEGIGAQRAEGFGRVAVNPPWCAFEKLCWDKPEVDHLRLHTAIIVSSTTHTVEAPKLLIQMQERLIQQELNKLVVAASQAIVRETLARQSQVKLSKSQLARLRLRVQRITTDAGFKEFNNYLKGTKERKSPDVQFRNFYVYMPVTSERCRFRDWMHDLAEGPEKVWSWIVPEGWKPPQLVKTLQYQTDNDLTVYYAVRLIDAVCEQLAKGKANR